MNNIDYQKLLQIANERDQENQDIIIQLEKENKFMIEFLTKKNLIDEIIDEINQYYKKTC